MDFPNEEKPSEEELIDISVKTLASFVGRRKFRSLSKNEEEARKKIYSVTTRAYTAFGALISEELAGKIEGGTGLPNVHMAVADSYLDDRNKDCGGDLFVDGKVIDMPQYDRRCKRGREKKTTTN